MTMQGFIEKHRIKMEATLTDRNPNMSDMPVGSTHWKCVLRRGGRRLTIPFSMGPAHSGEPDTAGVLDCLASDASGYENAPAFEDWASEYGYDTDSRKAERTYNAVKTQAEALARFLTAEQYDELLWHTDRE